MTTDSSLRLGVDIGGTFTDLFLIQPGGKFRLAKVPSTPDDPTEAVIAGIRRLCTEGGIDAASITEVVHGTTVATNAVLEGKGARVGLVATEGFAHVLHLARGQTPGPLAGWVAYLKPEPLADLEDTIEAAERLDASGAVLKPLDEARLELELASLITRGIESLTISFVHSHANPSHERRAAAIARKLAPELAVTTGSDVVKEFREYERTETAVVNAYIRPRVRGYLEKFSDQLANCGISAPVNLLRSDGGMMNIKDAAEAPVYAILSGPAGGVAGATVVAGAAGYRRILSLDMGGTSTDVCLSEGTPAMLWETRVGSFPVKVPSVDIVTVGAGGGSIAHVPEITGALRVGPDSAGASPGPACYGRGGLDATVTDANLVLGHITQSLLGGEMILDASAAQAAVGRVADAAGLELHEAARGIIRIANEHMLGALRVVSVERGLDPRDYCLVAFGGAGPMHANALADLLGSWPVIVPRAPGVLSALGASVTPYRAEFVTSMMRRLDRLDLGELLALQQEQEARADAWLGEQGVAPEMRTIRHQFDMRYFRQGLELPLEVPPTWLAKEGLDALRRQFNSQHSIAQGFSLDVQAEIVNVRVIAAGLREIELLIGHADGEDASAAVIGEQAALFEEEFVATAIYERGRLPVGARIDGPAIVVEADATTLVLPEHVCDVDQYLNLIIRPNGSLIEAFDARGSDGE